MKKLTNYLFLIALIFVSSCDLNHSPADIEPQIEAVPSSIGPEGEDPLDEGILQPIITVWVRYDRNIDPDSFRSQFGDDLGLSSYTNCTSPGAIEVWTVTGFTEAEFKDAVRALDFNGIILHERGTHDPRGNDPIDREKSSETPSTDSLYTVEFFFDDQCD